MNAIFKHFKPASQVDAETIPIGRNIDTVADQTRETVNITLRRAKDHRAGE